MKSGKTAGTRLTIFYCDAGARSVASRVNDGPLLRARELLGGGDGLYTSDGERDHWLSTDFDTSTSRIHDRALRILQ